MTSGEAITFLAIRTPFPHNGVDKLWTLVKSIWPGLTTENQLIAMADILSKTSQMGRSLENARSAILNGFISINLDGSVRYIEGWGMSDYFSGWMAQANAEKLQKDVDDLLLALEGQGSTLSAVKGVGDSIVQINLTPFRLTSRKPKDDKPLQLPENT